jgi:hypothetical protein
MLQFFFMERRHKHNFVEEFSRVLYTYCKQSILIFDHNIIVLPRVCEDSIDTSINLPAYPIYLVLLWPNSLPIPHL